MVALTEGTRWLPPKVRRLIRRVGDPLLSPFGSIRGVRTDARVVALTFDDGPDPASTPAVLDSLGAAGVRATFFLLVGRARANPGLVERMIVEGHEVGLHGPDHRRLTALPAGEVVRRLRVARNDLETVVGQPIRLFRPPFGSQSLTTWMAARLAGLEPVVWSIDIEDWVDQPIDTLVSRALAEAHPGGVLLLHDTLAEDPLDPATSARVSFDRPEMVAGVVGGLQAAGWGLMTVGLLLESGRHWRSVWFKP